MLADAGLRRAGGRGDPVGDEGLFGDQRSGSDASAVSACRLLRPVGASLPLGLAAPLRSFAARGAARLIHIRGPLPGQHFAEDRTQRYLSPCNRPGWAP